MSMPLQNDKVANCIWGDFFLDKNVRFPEFPVLVAGLSVYNAPYGLGMQFRGGPNKVVIKGTKTGEMYEFVQQMLDGKHTLADIFEKTEGKYETDDIASILKILHANSLLQDVKDIDNAKHAQDIAPQQQLAYYTRIAGRTSYNKNGVEIHHTIKATKVLVIASHNLAPIVLANLNLAGINKIGLFHTVNAELSKTDFSNYDAAPMCEIDITHADNSEIQKELSTRIDDYQFVIVAFENPSTNFFQLLNNFCKNRNKPVVFFAIRSNTCEIGPYVPQQGTACYTCVMLRKNSAQSGAVYDNVYADGLERNNMKSDLQIKGFDILSANISVGLLVAEFTKIVSGMSRPALINRTIEYDFLNGDINKLLFPRVPGCPTCAV